MGTVHRVRGAGCGVRVLPGAPTRDGCRIVHGGTTRSEDAATVAPCTRGAVRALGAARTPGPLRL
ncbi:hypothetical protein [Streptomyces canus]|uniref:hypothetical protein n=1 Tax=Streptomyces canus TaxID=58343 RepID=UPI0030E47190